MKSMRHCRHPSARVWSPDRLGLLTAHLLPPPLLSSAPLQRSSRASPTACDQGPMCIAFFLWEHPQLPDLQLVALFNRDEVLGRWVLHRPAQAGSPAYWQPTPYGSLQEGIASPQPCEDRLTCSQELAHAGLWQAVYSLCLLGYPCM